MVIIDNSWIIVTSDDNSYNSLKSNLTFIEPTHKRRIKNRVYNIPEKYNILYQIKDNNLYIPVGLLSLLQSSGYFNNSTIVDNRDNNSIICDKDIINKIINNMNSYSNILPGIKLRSEQLITLRKIFHFKRCLCQLVTGSGKTEIMCALIKILQKETDYTPTTLILEPTRKLVSDTISRFTKYSISAIDYSSNRHIENNIVNICHPKSLCNDLERDPNLLSNVDIMIGDECHHLRSNTFRTPTYHMNTYYNIGLSASAINQNSIMSNNIRDYTFDELLVIGATGPLVINIKAKFMLGDKLADPVVLIFNNEANEPIKESEVTNWSVVSSIRLESNKRTELITNISKFFVDNNRKVLILVRTTAHARKILESLYDLGLSQYSRASYGGGYFEKYNGQTYEQDSSDVFENYSNSSYKILIGTQHLIEGVDVPNLDVVILAYAGKSEKVLIQSVGRVLRKTKSGKYGYIIDFNDIQDIILSKHSKIRLDRYKNTIGVPSNHIYTNIDIDDLPNIFNSLEN